LTTGRIILFVSAGTVIVLGGIGYWYYTSQIELLKNSIVLTPVRVQLGSYTTEKADLLLTLRISNESNLDAEILDFSGSVILNGIKLADITLNKDQFIDATTRKTNILPARGYSDIDLVVSFAPNKILGDAWTIIKQFANTKDIAIQLADGQARIKTGFIKTTIPIPYYTTLQQILTSPT
jgi:LEA14-like dessication related protein